MDVDVRRIVHVEVVLLSSGWRVVGGRDTIGVELDGYLECVEMGGRSMILCRTLRGRGFQRKAGRADCIAPPAKECRIIN
ncbi:hypothetical protein HNY73_008355 [Argiope bruennichi]|uniref:Uncharacterized protein n=1 Tax=Argiope bruennichi TaxID=94029 RepID=A0A8T0FB71_ARGBR|nr:hypothetical protein HNY73_008355 [Argiope bruennichi]